MTHGIEVSEIDTQDVFREYKEHVKKLEKQLSDQQQENQALQNQLSGYQLLIRNLVIQLGSQK